MLAKLISLNISSHRCFADAVCERSRKKRKKEIENVNFSKFANTKQAHIDEANKHETQWKWTFNRSASTLQKKSLKLAHLHSKFKMSLLATPKSSSSRLLCHFFPVLYSRSEQISESRWKYLSSVAFFIVFFDAQRCSSMRQVTREKKETHSRSSNSSKELFDCDPESW